MICRLNHVAIVVPDLLSAIDFYQDTLGAEVSEPVMLQDHGVHLAFVEMGGVKIELLEKIDESSPIAVFLNKNPRGGVHHLCFQVDDILKAKEQMRDKGVVLLGDEEPKIGAHGKPVLFLHPKSCFGTLIELEQK